MASSLFQGYNNKSSKIGGNVHKNSESSKVEPAPVKASDIRDQEQKLMRPMQMEVEKSGENGMDLNDY
jgi:hypothetical protein